MHYIMHLLIPLLELLLSEIGKDETKKQQHTTPHHTP
jgi:hypothetical protein